MNLSLAARVLLASSGWAPLVLAQSTLDVPAQFPTIQGAIDAAVDGDTILVAPGLYAEHSLDTLGKAIHLRGVRGPEETVIVAGAEGRAMNIRSGEGRDTIIEGLRFFQGRAPDSGGASSSFGGFGGGLRIIDASPTLRDLVIGGCVAGTGATGLDATEDTLGPAGTGGQGGRGGGAYVKGGNPLFEGVVFRNNRGGRGGTGGRGLAPSFGIGSSGGVGGVGGDGGALWIGDGAVVEMRSCRFWSNFSGVGGSGGAGGVGVDNPNVGGSGGSGTNGGSAGRPGRTAGIVVSDAELLLEHCTILDNAVGLPGAPGPGGGGGIGGPGGSPGQPGEPGFPVSPGLVESTTLTQLRGANGVGSLIRLRASTVRADGVTVGMPLLSDTVEIESLSNVEGSLDPLTIDEDPMYTPVVFGDFGLQAGSPNIDRVAAPAGLNFDYEGQPRVFGALADIGADEFYALPGSGEDLTLAADVDGLGAADAPYLSAAAGQTYRLTLSSPNGGFTGAPALLGYQPFAFGGQLGPDLVLTDLQLDAAAPGLQVLPFGNGLVGAGSTEVSIDVPAGLVGVIVRFQAAAVDAGAANGVAALSDARDVGLF